jgi:uncharacterized membrane protein
MPTSRNRKGKKTKPLNQTTDMNKKGEVSLKQNNDGSRQITGKLYQGVFPSPEMLKEYAEIDPELPNRLIKWTEEESNHRRKLDNKIVSNSAGIVKLGILAGLVTVLFLCVLSFFYLYRGHAGEGKWIALSIAGVVGIFVIRKYVTSSSKEK